jgi:hypothetical protein
MPIHPVILKSRALRHYLRRDVASAIADECENREVAVRFVDRFGKRPERIDTAPEVFEFSRSAATSFHISEELWSDPLTIETGMSERDTREKRIGWDLIIDVDCPDWELSKTIARCMLNALDSYGIRTRSIKFSGNKGFHIGVPTEAFPVTITTDTDTYRTSDLFPDVTRIMLKLLAQRVADEQMHIHETSLELAGAYYPWSFLAELIGVDERDIIVRRCERCGASGTAINHFRCGICQREFYEKKDYVACPDHGPDSVTLVGAECSACRSRAFSAPEIDIESILHLDTMLISNRHMFRSPYSLHEKSGLVSVVIPEQALSIFEKSMAKPEYLATPLPFLSNAVRLMAKPNEGRELLVRALTHHEEDATRMPQYSDEVDLPDEAISEEHFPPSITRILKGIMSGGEPLKDGRKRSVLILINFLRCVGWDQQSVEQRLFAWNQALEDPLREVYIKGQLRHAFRNAPVLPPNYENKEYYLDIGVYEPDTLERTLKNPVQYAKRKHEAHDG